MKSHLHVTIDPQLKHAFSALCSKNGISISAALSLMIRAELASDYEATSSEEETVFSTFLLRQ